MSLTTLIDVVDGRRHQAEWHTDAACNGKDPDLFFPERGDNASAHRALAICAGCPVRDDCLAAHLHEHIGIFGGTTTLQRRAIRRALRQDTSAA